MKKRAVAVAGIIVGLALSGCDTGGSNAGAKASNEDSNLSAEMLDQFQRAQPAEKYNYSQLRQNLIEIQRSQANSTATTSFMFLMAGSGSTGPLVHWCPSIGFPIPSTAQITSPDQRGHWRNGEDFALSQIEPTGVYTGDSTGTYVICIDPKGKPYAFYHEGFVSTISGPAHWDIEKGEIVIDGPPTGNFTSAKK